MFKGAILDLDGVILNTVGLHFEAWRKMFAEHGVAFTFEDYKREVDGIPRLDGARAILKDMPEGELEKAAAKKQWYFIRHIEEAGVEVHESSRRLMEGLITRGIKLAIVSSSRNCRFLMDKAGIGGTVLAVISGMDIEKGKGKPNPWIFEEAARRLGLEPAECVAFEDAALGVEASKRAGMKTVGIDRHGDPARLARADLVVKDLAEIDYEGLKALVER